MPSRRRARRTGGVGAARRLPANRKASRASPAAIGGGRRTLWTPPMTPFFRSGLWPLVALCAGLVGLGVLEYRWTDELAGAEEDRLRGGMEAASVRFADDLSREMARLLRAFRLAPLSGSEDQRRYARQVEEWKAEAADPGLLVSVLIARDEGGSWQLRRLDGDQLVDAEWAPELQPIHDRLIGRDVTRLAPGVSPFVPEVPALVVGLRPPWPPGPG